MKSDWEMVSTGINPGSAAAIGAGVGIAGGAAAGAAVDAGTGGLSLGLGTLVGGLIGALGGAGAAAVYNANHQKKALISPGAQKPFKAFSWKHCFFTWQSLTLVEAEASGSKAKAQRSGKMP